MARLYKCNESELECVRSREFHSIFGQSVSTATTETYIPVILHSRMKGKPTKNGCVNNSQMDGGRDLRNARGLESMAARSILMQTAWPACRRLLCKFPKDLVRNNGLLMESCVGHYSCIGFAESHSQRLQRHYSWYRHCQLIRPTCCAFALCGVRLREEVQHQNWDRLCEETQHGIIKDEHNYLSTEGAHLLQDNLSVNNTRRLGRLLHLEALRRRLQELPNDCISYKQFLHFCQEFIPATVSANSSDDLERDGRCIAKLLEGSGQILIIGHIVYLHPEQLTRAIQNIFPGLSPTRREELERMEKMKGEIDVIAERIVRRELWCGFGLVVLQTMYFMWLTFWKLSWDVMEPISFFLASIYFLAGYVFFLQNSMDPTFENLFKTRFNAWQRRMMINRKFDNERFRELQRICKFGLRS